MPSPFLIVGLGNPGRRYEKTRHNVGFMVVDRLAERWDVRFRKLNSYELGEVLWKDERVFLAKPLTYMNNSGFAVSELVRYYRIELNRLLVILDDVELPFGRLRIRRQGSSGGHNGLDSIITQLGSKEFARLRIGIGNEYAKRDMVDFVLSPFSKNEQEELESVLIRAVEAVQVFIENGVDQAMNRFN
ncbi:MAG: aminoacyl-tRNA hydrolase [candidate division KSB1 bacterium]|nr:aminoacyl-tRNA hydrolase [candidate division KSB1 bacterium]MDZ7345414.1 aminoacyl-tRNA hydrolase [candidate division KSB1 bacterium]